MYHCFFDNVNHTQVNPSDVKLNPSMVVYLLGPRNYAAFEKEFTVKHQYKNDYHRPAGKTENDFPSKEEWLAIYDEYVPDVNGLNATMCQHEYYLVKSEDFGREFLRTVQIFDMYLDKEFIDAGANQVEYLNDYYSDTFGIVPSALTGYIAGDVYKTIGSTNGNFIYHGSITYENYNK